MGCSGHAHVDADPGAQATFLRSIHRFACIVMCMYTHTKTFLSTGSDLWRFTLHTVLTSLTEFLKRSAKQHTESYTLKPKRP